MTPLQSTTQAEAAVEPERLSWEEICLRYPNQWVVLVEMDWIERNPTFAFRTAVVFAHSEKRGLLRLHSPSAAGYTDFCHLHTAPLRRWVEPSLDPT
jgi:hypothetical protein